VQIGTYISGAGHLALIGWAFFGGTFNTEPLPFEVQEVAVITTDQFDALMAAQDPPGVTTEPAALTPPDTTTPPDVASTPDAEPERTVPEASDTTPPDPVPLATPDPVPPAEVTDETPELTPPGSDVAVLLPPDTEPQPLPSERIAPQAVAPPDPEAAPDEVEREAVVPEEGPGETQQEPQEATAPEEAAPEIVTEAEEPAGAPTRSLRPPSRPSRPAVAQSADPEPATSAVDDAVAAALAENTQSQTPRAPVGPPLSAGERDALRVSVSNCWNVGSLSTAALSTTVVVGVDMQEDGRPVASSIRMLDFSGGPESAARQAFEAARRAIIRCGARGFPLPVEKFDHWREIEMTFNPENMRIR